MATMIRPLHDRVIIKRLDEEEQVRGGIIIPVIIYLTRERVEPDNSSSCFAPLSQSRNRSLPDRAWLTLSDLVRRRVGLREWLSGSFQSNIYWSSLARRSVNTTCRQNAQKPSGTRFAPNSRSCTKVFPSQKQNLD